MTQTLTNLDTQIQRLNTKIKQAILTDNVTIAIAPQGLGKSTVIGLMPHQFISVVGMKTVEEGGGKYVLEEQSNDLIHISGVKNADGKEAGIRIVRPAESEKDTRYFLNEELTQKIAAHYKRQGFDVAKSYSTTNAASNLYHYFFEPFPKEIQDEIFAYQKKLRFKDSNGNFTIKVPVDEKRFRACFDIKTFIKTCREKNAPIIIECEASNVQTLKENLLDAGCRVTFLGLDGVKQEAIIKRIEKRERIENLATTDPNRVGKIISEGTARDAKLIDEAGSLLVPNISRNNKDVWEMMMASYKAYSNGVAKAEANLNLELGTIYDKLKLVESLNKIFKSKGDYVFTARQIAEIRSLKIRLGLTNGQENEINIEVLANEIKNLTNQVCANVITCNDRKTYLKNLFIRRVVFETLTYCTEKNVDALEKDEMLERLKAVYGEDSINVAVKFAEERILKSNEALLGSYSVIFERTIDTYIELRKLSSKPNSEVQNTKGALLLKYQVLLNTLKNKFNVDFIAELRLLMKLENGFSFKLGRENLSGFENLDKLILDKTNAAYLLKEVFRNELSQLSRNGLSKLVYLGLVIKNQSLRLKKEATKEQKNEKSDITKIRSLLSILKNQLDPKTGGFKVINEATDSKAVEKNQKRQNLFDELKKHILSNAQTSILFNHFKNKQNLPAFANFDTIEVFIKGAGDKDILVFANTLSIHEHNSELTAERKKREPKMLVA